MIDLFGLSGIDFIANWIEYLVAHKNIIAPMTIMAIDELGIPLPIPGDFVIAYIGYQVSKGMISYHLAFFIILLSSLIGSTILYFLSLRYGQKILLFFGKYFHLDERKIVAIERHFKKNGIWVIIIGRHLPGFRIPITIFSGLSGISYPVFISSTFFSVIFGITFYLNLGQKIGAKTTTLIHSHPIYFLFAFVPILLFSLIFIYLKYRNSKKR